MKEIFRTDSGLELTVHEGWDRDGELHLSVMTGDDLINLYFRMSDIKRLRNALSIQLGE